jgi:hypothetical protein
MVFGKAVSRILSARISSGRESFVSATYTRNLFRFHETRSGQLLGFLFGLAPDGVFRAATLARARGGLLHHLFTLAASNRQRRSDFLWHFPSENLSISRLRVSQPNKLELRSIAPCGVRTFLPRLAPEAILRPSKTSVKLYEPAPFLKRQTFFADQMKNALDARRIFLKISRVTHESETTRRVVDLSRKQASSVFRKGFRVARICPPLPRF